MGLKAVDGSTIGWDTVTVSVYPEGYDLAVELTSNIYELELTGATDTINLEGTVTGADSSEVDHVEWVFLNRWEYYF